MFSNSSGKLSHKINVVTRAICNDVREMFIACSKLIFNLNMIV